jgi:hypothetical protein
MWLVSGRRLDIVIMYRQRYALVPRYAAAADTDGEVGVNSPSNTYRHTRCPPDTLVDAGSSKLLLGVGGRSQFFFLGSRLLLELVGHLGVWGLRF